MIIWQNSYYNFTLFFIAIMLGWAMAEVYNEMLHTTGNKNAIKTSQFLSVYPLRDCESELLGFCNDDYLK